MISWKETHHRLRCDKERLQEYYRNSGGLRPIWLPSSPSYQCLFFHRISNYFFSNGRRLLARLFWHLNLIITGADISPDSDIGPGLLLLKPAGSAIAATLGKNCCIMGHVAIGGGMSDTRDIGAGPGLPLIGDEVEISYKGSILGPVKVGHRAHIGPGCLVIRDIEDDITLEPRVPLIKYGDNL